MKEEQKYLITKGVGVYHKIALDEEVYIIRSVVDDIVCVSSTPKEKWPKLPIIKAPKKKFSRFIKLGEQPRIYYTRLSNLELVPNESSI